ncbi:MAG: family 10 glycosylhydrolase [Paludibacteraceae bacterium]|nr:family 10 glycosylhydrolase [Paludibacteraceae bacterium]MBP6283801.1 family 10 glycosylhydrolase [Paludibacteraceae bacterium]
MKYKHLVLCLLFCSLHLVLHATVAPKREFRGVWMHTVFNDEYPRMNNEQMKRFLVQRLDKYQAVGINVLIYQVRPEADAFYKSAYEPWSRYLTGKQGRAPLNDFDPMAFLIEECHSRGMEFHAWLNPYRANANRKGELHPEHLYWKRKDLFVFYGNQLFFNPGIPENRVHINNVVKDIVSRYDVDAIHMDDYFYPYPIKGSEFPDQKEFVKYGMQTGEFKLYQKDDWRRNNVNLLIKELNTTIKKEKPWVKFGISPFGIYRNKRSCSEGSNTKGLANYDDLYADVLLWVRNGWIDYNIPQLYWEVGHKLADYEILIDWWGKNSHGAHLYIGQDVDRTINAHDLLDKKKNQLSKKMELVRSNPVIEGNCFWSADMLVKSNALNDSLKNNYHRYPALIPVFKNLDSIPPAPVSDIRFAMMGKEPKITWSVKKTNKELDKAVMFAIYAFEKTEKIDISNPAKLLSVVNKTEFVLPRNAKALCLTYIITALDRLKNESVPSEPLFYK